MTSRLSAVLLFVSASAIQAQSLRPKFEAFEVATIKPVDPEKTAGRYITMQGPRRFVVKNYNLKLLIAAAYDLTPRAVSGGPAWLDSEKYEILALTPGEARPSHDQQMSMLRNLLTERFRLTFHREPKKFAIYALEVSKSGAKLKESAASPDASEALVSTVYPQHVLLPARNATMAQFVSLLQRAVLDRPVVDRTNLSGRYDFDLQWAPDDSQFGGELPAPGSEPPSAPFFTAIQQQLGLRLESTQGLIATLIVDSVEKPSAN